MQGTGACTGKHLTATGLDEDELGCVTSVGVGGVHVGPFAVFCVLGLLDFTTGLPRLQPDQRAPR